MRGQSSSEHSRVKRHSNQQGESWSIGIDIPGGNAQTLKKYMQNELDFYNHLVNSMRPALSSSPEKFLEFNDNHINLFAQLAENRLDIRKVMRDIPPGLETFQKVFTDGSITEFMKIIFEGAIHPGAIAAKTRKAMAKEILAFNIAQASQRTKKASASSGNVFRNTTKSLNPQDIITKRHLQVPKEAVQIVWDPVKEESRVKCPYALKGFRIPNVDLSHKKSWNVMVIHQEPNHIPDLRTPWCLDFRGSPQSYLVDYLDQQNTKLGVFFQVKPGRGH